MTHGDTPVLEWIESVRLSRRAYNSLHNEAIYHRQQLEAGPYSGLDSDDPVMRIKDIRSLQQLLRIPNIGRLTAAEISAELQRAMGEAVEWLGA